MQGVREGNREAVNKSLRQYKLTNGAPNFPELFKVPIAERLPSLFQINPDDTLDVVAAGLTLAIESMNLKRGLNPSQLNDLAEEICDSATEDNLSFEDLILFMQRLVRGQYGELYESMDIPKFMNLFGKYRDERWAEGIKIRDQKHEEYKNLGDKERSDRPMTAFDQHLADYNTKLQAKNDEIKLLRKERQKRHEQDNF